MKILYPIHIDRFQSPIASLLREIAVRCQSFTFYSFSKPITEEDVFMGRTFWSLKHVKRIKKPIDILFDRFDIVHHASSTWRNFTAATIAKKGGAMHVFTANVEPYEDDPYINFYKHSVKSCDILVAVSEAVSKSVRIWFNREADFVIPNGVDTEFFSRDKAIEISQDIRRPFVLFCATLERRKRPDIFFSIARQMPEIDFVVIGGFHWKNEAEPFLREIHLLPNVKYLGRQPRATVRDIMASASALIFPSEIEGLPLSVLEALSIGLPVLAQPKSSLPEVIISGETGWLIDGEDIQGWKNKILDILSWNYNQKKYFEHNARSFVLRNYSWKVIASKYRKVYQEAIQAVRA